MANVRQLEHVAALAEHRNFHRAAAAAGVTQSALTQSIQKLEAEYGVLLFERSKRDVQPTAFGLVVIEAAKETLFQLSHLKREIDLMKNLKSGRLIIGCDTLISEALLGPTLVRMVNRYPDLRFTVHVGAWDDLRQDLLSSRIDIYIGSPLDVSETRLKMIDIRLPSVVIACNPRHPLLAKDKVSVGDCFDYPIAGPRQPPWYYDWLARQFGDGVPGGGDISSIYLESDDYGIIRWLVRHTDTLTGILPALIAEDLANGSLRTLNLESLNFPLPAVIAVLAGRPLPPAAEMLIEEILNEVQVQERAGATKAI